MAFDGTLNPQSELLLKQADSCRRLAGIIEAREPSQYNQDSWGVDYDVAGDRDDDDEDLVVVRGGEWCGTPACMAGWAWIGMSDELPKGPVSSMSGAPAELLGLPIGVFSAAMTAQHAWQTLLGDPVTETDYLRLPSQWREAKLYCSRDRVVANLRRAADMKEKAAAELTAVALA